MGAMQMKEDGVTPLLTKNQTIGLVPSNAMEVAQLLLDHLAQLSDVRQSRWSGLLLCDNVFAGLPVSKDALILQCRFKTLYPHFPKAWQRPTHIMALPSWDADVEVMPYKKAVDFTEQIDCVFNKWLDRHRPVFIEIGPSSDDYVVSIVLGVVRK